MLDLAFRFRNNAVGICVTDAQQLRVSSLSVDLLIFYEKEPDMAISKELGDALDRLRKAIDNAENFLSEVVGACECWVWIRADKAQLMLVEIDDYYRLCWVESDRYEEPDLSTAVPIMDLPSHRRKEAADCIEKLVAKVRLNEATYHEQINEICSNIEKAIS
jgi:hypothetical protein